MTLKEALEASRSSGKAYERRGDDDATGQFGYGGWLKWDEDHYYSDLKACDLVADDWVELEKQ